MNLRGLFSSCALQRREGTLLQGLHGLALDAPEEADLRHLLAPTPFINMNMHVIILLQQPGMLLGNRPSMCARVPPSLLQTSPRTCTV